ncbi:hypothetical protein PUN28_005174 [Cardiocondyla obscurior]|uniref:Uncharacterized protein n=1 Tax=Cardiocondyla obscurior TaxID=286306 RepID=A0AAW2GF36_9HYME
MQIDKTIDISKRKSVHDSRISENDEADGEAKRAVRNLRCVHITRRSCLQIYRFGHPCFSSPQKYRE